MAYHKYGVHFETGLTAGQDLAFLLCLAGALLGWSWTCGFVLGSLSGRAVWLTWSVFYLVVLDSAWARFVLAGNIILRDPRPLRLLMVTTLPLSIAALLFLFPALFGAFVGVRRRVLPVRYAYLLGSVIAILTILTTWMSGWYETAHEVWSGGVWPRSFMASAAAAISVSKLAGRLPARYRLPATHRREDNHMNAVPVRIAMVTMLAAASAIAQSTVRAALQPALERKPAAGFALRDAAGKKAKLKKYRGKVVVLDFWATWCTGCKREIPWFVEFQQKFGTRHFAVVGVSLDEGGWDVLKPFLAKAHVPYRMVLGDDSITQRYGIQNMPDTFLIDRRGRVAAAYIAGIVDKDNVESNIHALLAER